MENQNKEKVKNKKKIKIFKKLSYLFVWLILLLEIFKFNIVKNLYLEIVPPSIYKYFPEYLLVTILLFVFIIIVLIFRIKKIISWLIGFLIYPLYLLVWILFKICFLPLFNLALKIISFTKTIGCSFISFLLFAFSFYTIYFYISVSCLVKMAMVALFSALILFYLKTFHQIYKPPTPFRTIQSLFSSLWENLLIHKFSKNIKEWKALDPSGKDYQEKKKETFKQLWICNRFAILFTKIFTDEFKEKIKGRRLLVGSFIWTVSFALFSTIITFAFEYYALENMYPNSISGISSFFDSFYLSFTTIFTMSSGNIIPISDLARLFTLLEVFFGFIIVILLFLIFTTVTMATYEKELATISEKLIKLRKDIEGFIEKEYEKKIEEIKDEYKINDKKR